MKPICFFMPTSNLIIEKSQITLKLASKDVEKVAFQEMKKSVQFGKVDELVFIFSVTSKVRIYENLKNVFQEAMGKKFSQAKHHEKSNMVENHLQHSLNLSSKNVKNAFFEYMTRHRSENGTTVVTFTFTLLSTSLAISNPSYWLALRPIITDPIYAEIEDAEIEYAEIEDDSQKESIKEKSLLKKTMGFFNKRFSRKSFPIPQARYTLHAFDSGFECGTESCEDFKRPLNNSRDDDPIYKERKLSDDSGYETIASPRASIRSTFSDYEIPRQVGDHSQKELKENNPPPIPWATHPSRRKRAISNPLCERTSQLTNSGYEIPRQIEPAIYLEVLP